MARREGEAGTTIPGMPRTYCTTIPVRQRTAGSGAEGSPRPGSQVPGAPVRPHPAMARILAACTLLHGRRLQHGISLPWRKGVLISHRSFGILTALQPWSRRAHGLWGAQPRLLGALAPQGALEQKPNTESVEQFRLIYRFPAIKHCRALSRLKLLQTTLTALVLPPVWFLYWQNHVTEAQCQYSTGVACFAAVMLYGMSFFLRRIIGMMYLNEDGTVLRVAHLTFWGRRRDIYCPVETVMTLGDMGENRNDLLLRFRQYDQENFLYFSLHFGQIVDKEGFAKVFGELQYR